MGVPDSSRISDLISNCACALVRPRGAFVLLRFPKLKERTSMTISRRKLIQVAGAGAAALALPKKTLAAKKTLRILQWNHFVPAYDKWFNGQYIKEWGEKNDTEVIVDNVGVRSEERR